MNPWDALSWLCSLGLAGSASVIFALFARDARRILTRDLHHSHDDDEPSRDDQNDGG